MARRRRSRRRLGAGSTPRRCADGLCRGWGKCRLDGAEILDDTFVAWLESDLSIAILSSACWEARALGCRVVIGIGPEAGIYSAELLESLAYPQAGDTIFDVIDHELSCMSAATRASPMARLRNMPTRTLAS